MRTAGRHENDCEDSTENYEQLFHGDSIPPGVFIRYRVRVTGRWWIVRDRISRILRESPAPPATWSSVIRRSAIVTFFFLLGVATDQLTITIFAAFGALQIGLMEAALPAKSLAKMLGAMVIACTLASLIAMLIGGTWWVVLYITAFAYVFGCVAGLSSFAMTVGVGSIALAVIFAGQPQTPGQAVINAGWLALGAIVQAIAWLIPARHERRAMVRRAIASKLRADIKMVRTAALDAPTVIAAHKASDSVIEMLDSAQFPAPEAARLRTVFSDAITSARALVAWMVMRVPGDADRLDVALAIESDARRLDDVPRKSRTVFCELSDENPMTQAVNATTAALHHSVDVEVRQATAENGELVSIARPRSLHPAPVREYIAALRPGSAASIHGLRMAVGLGVAEVLTMLLPFEHSFWLPLTVVFTLKPDWSFTLVRGLSRTIGNLAAVIVLPVLFMVVGATDSLLAVALLVLTMIMYREFFGNYTMASFGLAGSVLLLDTAIDPDTNLFLVRILAATLGALLSLAVALAIPNWSSTAAPKQAAEFVAALTTLQSNMRKRFDDAASVSDDILDENISAARRALTRLEATVNGAVLEPRLGRQATNLAILLESGTQLFLHMLAMTYYMMTAQRESSWAPDAPAVGMQRLRLDQAQQDMDRAVKAIAAE